MNENQCAIYIPTIGERFWRAIGFNSHIPELDDPTVENRYPGWIMTNVRIKADVLDRLRFLLCGKALVRVVTYTSVQVDAVSASSFELIPPFTSWESESDPSD